MKIKGRNMAASVRQRLLDLKRAHGWDIHRVLGRYGVERLLFRLSQSRHARRFLLKGAMLFTVWEGIPHRATKDVDLLGLRRRSVDEMVALFREVMQTPVEPDGIVFEEITGEEIRATTDTGGIRLMVRGKLDSARIAVQVDVGFGDAVVPPPVEVDFPTLLDSPKPKLRAYPPETVIAEKLEAMLRLGIANSRMKDFFDVWHLSRSHPFRAAILLGAIKTTFATRGTVLPSGPVVALTSEFANDRSKQTQWAAFISQAAIAEQTPSLSTVIGQLAAFFAPLLDAIRSGKLAVTTWEPKRGWAQKHS